MQGERVYVVHEGALVVCLAPGLAPNLIEDIVRLRRDLAPELMRLVVRDSAFASDVDKTNFLQTLQAGGITEVQCL